MYILLLSLLTIQQWSIPLRVSPDTLPDTNPAICTSPYASPCICWYKSNSLWSIYRLGDFWQPLSLVDSTKCIVPEVTTLSMCKDAKWGFPWIAWTDSSGHIRLSVLSFIPNTPMWITAQPDSRIKGYNPAITSDADGNIWCAWTAVDTSGAEYCYLVSHYSGNVWNEWAEPCMLKRFVPVEVTYTTGITTDYRGNIWVSYNDHEYIMTQYWDGSSWSVPESIGACFDYAYPTMCADSSNVWVAWYNSMSGPNGWQIMCRYYAGIEWSEVIEFPLFSTEVDVALHMPHQDICVGDRGKLWAVWWEDMGVYCPNYMISACSYYEGSWLDSAIVDSCIMAYGGNPSIACGDGKVWIVWQSEREGNYNIYASYTELVVGVEDKPISTPSDFILLQNYPNPFSQSTEIRYSCPSSVSVSLKIYDLSGRLVRTLVDEPITNYQSPITAYWDGKDEVGRDVSSGIYFYQLRASDSIEHTRKLLLLR